MDHCQEDVVHSDGGQQKHGHGEHKRAQQQLVDVELA
jgi:hypothetical protein